MSNIMNTSGPMFRHNRTNVPSELDAKSNAIVWAVFGSLLSCFVCVACCVFGCSPLGKICDKLEKLVSKRNSLTEDTNGNAGVDTKVSLLTCDGSINGGR